MSKVRAYRSAHIHPSARIHPSAQVHPSAVISDSAQIGAGVQIGPYAVIGEQSRIAENCQIGPYTQIGDLTEIGPACRIAAHAVVGSPSQDLKHQYGDLSWLKIGARNRIREFVTINRATAGGDTTRLGDDNLLMAYAHVAHDCQLGNRIVLANGATLGGHVQVADDVIIGAMSGIHQFVQIGRLVMVGAMSRVCNDVPPFMLCSGSPPKLYGLNSVGLRRAGVRSSVRQALKNAYQSLYRQNLSLEQALAELESMSTQEVTELLQFCQQSQRGLVGYKQSIF